MKYEVNLDAIPLMAIGFTRAETIISRGIQLVRGDLRDKAQPNHAFIVTQDHGYKFALEETFDGLKENSICDYDNGKNGRIVAMYLWNGWTPELAEMVTRYLAKIRSYAAAESEYDTWGLMTFIPGLRRFFHTDPLRNWCSESVVSLHLMAWCNVFVKQEIAPDELLRIVQNSNQFKCVLGYYK